MLPSIYRNAVVKVTQYGFGVGRFSTSSYLCKHESETDDTASIKSNDSVKSKESGSSKSDFPQEPSACCMSGCANCVWLDYAEQLSEYFKDGGEAAIKEIHEKVQDPNIKAFLLSELRMRLKNKQE